MSQVLVVVFDRAGTGWKDSISFQCVVESVLVFLQTYSRLDRGHRVILLSGQGNTVTTLWDGNGTISPQLVMKRLLPLAAITPEYTMPLSATLSRALCSK